MHLSSYNKMIKFVDKYLNPKEDLKVLDIGSNDVNGSYRNLFNKKWSYSGLDIEPGPNVDIIVSDHYKWDLLDESYDVVVSGQAFEHIEYFWLTMEEIGRILKPGGLCCIIAPSDGPDHKCPLDCWRFHYDGFKVLAKCAKLDMLEVSIDTNPQKYLDRSELWKDGVLIAKKPNDMPSL